MCLCVLVRWSVKLALDSILLGGFDSDDELLDTLEEYSSSWYIGLDSDPGWRQAVLDETPSLFSLGYDDTRVRSRESEREGGVSVAGGASVRAGGVRGIGVMVIIEDSRARCDVSMRVMFGMPVRSDCII